LTELTTPLKPLEAMAMERVVVGSRVGGIRELLDGHAGGHMVRAEDPRALAACLSELAAQESERRAAGKSAREFVVRERDWEQIVSRYSRVYERAGRDRVNL